MNYNGQNWEIGDTLVHLQVFEIKVTLIAHSRSVRWEIPDNLKPQVAFEGRYMVDAGKVLIRSLVDYGVIQSGTLLQEDPKYLTKLLPPPIEVKKTQDTPIDESV